MVQHDDRDLIFAILRAGSAADCAQQVGQATAADWADLVRFAGRRGIAPLFYWQLKTLGLSAQLPPEIAQDLRTAYLSSANRSMRLYHHLARLLAGFQRADIAVIPLKGVYLAEIVYGNTALRTMGDVDILVKKADMPRVEQLMLDMGFERTDLLHEMINERHHFGYRHPQTGLYAEVQVHWDLINAIFGAHADVDGLWARSRPTTIAGVPVSGMAPEDLLLHLCVHAAAHSLDVGIRALCDISRTVHHFASEINWPLLQQRAGAWEARRCAYVSLWLTREFLHTPVPDSCLDALRPEQHDMPYVAFARQHMLRSGEESDRALPGSREVARLWMEGSIVGKAIRLWKSIFLPRRVMATMYPAPPGSLRILLYYPLRVRDILRRHGRVAWQLVRGDEQMLSRAGQQHQINALRDWLLSG